MDLGMDMWKYFGITHTDHAVMDPLSLEKTREFVRLLRLPEGARVLDVACDTGAMLHACVGMLLSRLNSRDIYEIRY